MSRDENQNCAARILQQCRSVFTANTSICVDIIGTNGNKNNLRTIETQIVQTLKNNEPQPKFTGSDKKSVYIDLCVLFGFRKESVALLLSIVVNLSNNTFSYLLIRKRTLGLFSSHKVYDQACSSDSRRGQEDRAGVQSLGLPSPHRHLD